MNEIFNPPSTVWVDNRADTSEPLPVWWGDDSILPTEEEIQKMQEEIRLEIREKMKAEKSKIRPVNTDDWNRPLI